MNELMAIFKQRLGLYSVVILSLAVFAGQLVEAGGFSLEDLPDFLRDFFDPAQYMVGMMLISLILIIKLIRKHDSIPNDFLVTLKWYFTIIFLRDFTVLMFKIIQKSNVLSFANSFTGTGKAYLIFASVRSITDLAISTIAQCVLIYGLTRYSLQGKDMRASLIRISRILIVALVLKLFLSIPANMTGLLNNQTLFILSLGFSQITGLFIAVMILRMANRQVDFFKTGFFRKLKTYFGINLVIVALNFIYSIGSYGLLQRFPAGEAWMLGGFGKVVLIISLIALVVQNYLIYSAIEEYNEQEDISGPETLRETPEEVISVNS